MAQNAPEGDVQSGDNPDPDGFHVRFWGVRGSIACGGSDYARYGGNTPCLEVTCGGRTLIFDAGTGLRPLGLELAAKDIHEFDLFLTHSHYDHVCGLPFFQPFYNADATVRIWSGHLENNGKTSDIFWALMEAPLLPITPDIFNATLDFKEFISGERLEVGDGISLRTAPLNHPNGAVGYRIEYGGQSICYVTDTEHVPGEPDKYILALIDGADIVIYDATYTDEEWPRFRGFGHSTWQEGARLCDSAGAGQYVIFHHDPMHDDPAMDDIAAAAARARPGTVVAREGMVLSP